MAAKTEAALTKQLHRELEHKKWLAKHLQGTKQQRDSLTHTRAQNSAHTTDTQAQHTLVVSVVPKKKSAPEDALSL